MVAPALYGVGATSVPGIKLAGSAFLNSNLAGGIAAGAANLLGQSSNKSVNFRGKYERKRAQFARAQLGPDTRARVEAVKSAGLHPLAALGITPGASSMSQGQMPGQSPDYGSAISEGIRTTQQMAGRSQRDTQSRTIAGLQVQEQQLRNDFLAEQIKSSQMKRLTDLSNSMRPPMGLYPNKEEEQRRFFLSRNKKSYTSGPGTPYQVLENELGEGAQIMPSMILNLWDAFWADMYNVNEDSAVKLNKHLQGRREKFKSHANNPDPYKGMGKSHY